MSDDTIDITDLDPTQILKAAKAIRSMLKLLYHQTQDAGWRREMKRIDAQLARIAEIREANEPLEKGLEEIRKSIEGASSLSLEALSGIQERLQGIVPVRSDHQAALVEYLKDLLDETSTLDIRGIGSRPGAQKEVWEPPPIESIYTPLSTADRSDNPTEGKEHLGTGDRAKTGLSELLSTTRRLLFIGEPGGGKTTFLKLIASVLARDWLQRDEPGYEPGRGEHLGLSVDLPPRVSVFVRLSSMADHLQDMKKAGVGAWKDLGRCLERMYTPETAVALVGELEAGRAALLLDGLDEVTGKVRKRVLGFVDAAIRRWSDGRGGRGENLVVVTTRPFGYEEVAALAGIRTARIDPFGVPEITRFLHNWVRYLFGEEAKRKPRKYLKELDEAIVAVPEVRRLARNPVMLTCLCVVHWNERSKLPPGKALLVQAVLRWLVKAHEEQREARGFSVPFTHAAFEAVAFEMTALQDGKKAQVDLDWAADQLKEVFKLEKRISDTDQIRHEGRKFLQAEPLESGVIQELSGEKIRFWHLTFQEHYAARRLAGMSTEQWWGHLKDHLGDRQWMEVFDHFPGCLEAQNRRDQFPILLDKILGTADPDDLKATACAVGVIGRILPVLDLLKYRIGPGPGWEDARRRVLDVFEQEPSRGISPLERVEAAEALALGGDPRFEPGIWCLPAEPAAGFVEIPKGVLTMGSKDDPQEWDDETPQHRVSLSRYWIGRYPVTVGQYLAYCEDTGLEPPEEIEEVCCTAPMRYVTWMDAARYADWLDGQLRGIADERVEHAGSDDARAFWAALRDRKAAVGLPSEAEWERAARGDTAWRYPWGDELDDADRLNYGPTRIGQPSPVGCFPRGGSPYGVQDLSGNVWEWTRSRWTEYPETDLEGLEIGEFIEKPGRGVVLRGGSFSYLDRLVRAAIRGHFHADFRYGSVGFRVCASPLFVQI